MKEISSETFNTMQAAVSSQTEQSVETYFNYKRELPENLQALETISMNFFWSWNADGTEIFRELSPTLWENASKTRDFF